METDNATDIDFEYRLSRREYIRNELDGIFLTALWRRYMGMSLLVMAILIVALIGCSVMSDIHAGWWGFLGAASVFILLGLPHLVWWIHAVEDWKIYASSSEMTSVSFTPQCISVSRNGLDLRISWRAVTEIKEKSNYFVVSTAEGPAVKFQMKYLSREVQEKIDRFWKPHLPSGVSCQAQ